MILLEKELAWRNENERYQFYEPNGVCEKAIRHIASSQDIVTILSAANGIGKTTLIVNLFANLFWPGHNRYFDYPLFKNWPYPKNLRYITDQKIVEESGPFHAEIKKWWPKGMYESAKLGRSYVCQYKVGDWVLDVMTNDQDTGQFEGGTKGGILFDEPPKENIWHASVSRLRLGGLLLVFMTPLTEAAWFFDKVVPNHVGSIFYATMEDACKQHGVRGHLEHDHIQKMLVEMSQDEIDARAYGKALYLKGLIFKTYDENVHVLKEELKPPYGANIWQAVDPHSDKPFACIWAFPDARGDLYIFDEWPNEDFYKMRNCQLDIQDYKKIFADKEAGLNIHRRVIDRHFADTASAANKRTLRQELQAIGLNYWPSYKAEEEVETGIIKVRERFAYDTSKPLSALNQPKIYINPSCTNTRKSLSRWARDPETGKVQDSYKDFCDCVRYLVMDSPKVAEVFPAYNPIKRWGGA